jgi:hypothetical protein
MGTWIRDGDIEYAVLEKPDEYAVCCRIHCKPW